MHPGLDGNAQHTGPRSGLDLRAGQRGADVAESPAAGAILPHPPEGESALQSLPQEPDSPGGLGCRTQMETGWGHRIPS